MPNSSSEIILEVPVFDVQSAINASGGGAHRLEICACPKSGGETPSIDFVEEVLTKITLPVMVMIRSRGGNFVYDENEQHNMLRQIREFNQLPVSGYVFGALTSLGDLDCSFLQELIHATDGRDFTLHRAIDFSRDIFKNLEAAFSLGFRRVLTSGAKPSAIDGIENLRKMMELAGNDISIMPGSGIHPNQISEFKKLPFLKEIHASCKLVSPEKGSDFESMLGSADGITQKQNVELIITALQQ